MDLVFDIIGILIFLSIILVGLMTGIPFALAFAARQRTERALHEADFESIEQAEDRISFLYGKYTSQASHIEKLTKQLSSTTTHLEKAQRESQDRLEALVTTEEQLRKMEAPVEPEAEEDTA